MRQPRAIWLISQSQGAEIKLKKERKTHENAITTQYIQGSPRGKANIKFKRSMQLLLKDMVGLKRDSHTLKEKCQHGHQMQYKI